MTSEVEYRLTVSGRACIVEIHNRTGLLYRLHVPSTAKGDFFGRKSDFELVDGVGECALQIRRTRRQPYARYSLTRGDRQIGTISCSNLLQSRYSVALVTGL